MKTIKRILAFTIALLFISVALLAQDSTATGPVVVDTFLGLTIPELVKTVIISLLIVLPGVQLVLKRIPTPGSVKIQGVLGKILDLLTFFQKDKISTNEKKV